MAFSLRAMARCVPAGRAALVPHHVIARGYQAHAGAAVRSTGPFATRALAAALPATACVPNTVFNPAARMDGFPNAGSALDLGLGSAFHTGAALEKAITGDEKVAAVNELLKQTTAIAFNDRVELEAETRHIICYSELVSIGTETGMTEKEAEEMIDAMQTAGCLLRFQNAVYLRPSDVVDQLVENLPLPSAENSKLIASYEEKLAAIKAELRPLEEDMSNVHRSANSRARTYLWFGLFMLVFQLGAFIRLTFWELSWDVMEPIGFFVQLGGGIMAYSWFMFYGSEMNYGNMYTSYYTAGKEKKLISMPELATKHRSLLRQMQLYDKFLRWAKK